MVYHGRTDDVTMTKGSTLWSLKTNPLPTWQEGALTILCILCVKNTTEFAEEPTE